MKVNITVTELGKAREVNPYSYYSSHYEQFEQQVQTLPSFDTNGKELPEGWKGEAEMVHQVMYDWLKGEWKTVSNAWYEDMKDTSVNKFRQAYIAYIPEEKQPPVVENDNSVSKENLHTETVEQLGKSFYNELCSFVPYEMTEEELYVSGFIKGHMYTTSASGMVKVEEVIDLIRQSKVSDGKIHWPNLLIQQIRSLTNSK